MVARLTVQTHRLLEWADISKEEKTNVYATYDGLKKRLLKCHEAQERLCKAWNETVDAEHFNPDGTLKSLPHVIGLDGEVETILYETKNYLRDLLGIFGIFFGVGFDEASYFYDARGNGSSKVVKWAVDSFGETDPFTMTLVSEHEWIEELIRKRNAAEHPGGHSGTLQFHNFEKTADNQFVAPAWHRDDLPRTEIFLDVKVTLDNLLTLAEDMLVCCITKRTRFKIIKFVGIPEDKRDTNCPTRITVALKAGIPPARN